MALGVVSKFLVAAVRDLISAPGVGSEMILYVSLDGHTWSQAKFPHGSSSKLFENAYTIVESTTHSLAVDVLTHTRSTMGTLFVSNSNGTYFVESLKNTNRNEVGYVDFEDVLGVEGVGLANVVANAQEVDSIGARKRLQSVITFDDGEFMSFTSGTLQLNDCLLSKDGHGHQSHLLKPILQGILRNVHRRTLMIPRVPSIFIRLRPHTILGESSPPPLLAFCWASARWEATFCRTTRAILTSVRTRA